MPVPQRAILVSGSSRGCVCPCPASHVPLPFQEHHPGLRRHPAARAHPQPAGRRHVRQVQLPGRRVVVAAVRAGLLQPGARRAGPPPLPRGPALPHRRLRASARRHSGKDRLPPSLLFPKNDSASHTKSDAVRGPSDGAGYLAPAGPGGREGSAETRCPRGAWEVRGQRRPSGWGSGRR